MLHSSAGTESERQVWAGRVARTRSPPVVHPGRVRCAGPEAARPSSRCNRRQGSGSDRRRRGQARWRRAMRPGRSRRRRWRGCRTAMRGRPRSAPGSGRGSPDGWRRHDDRFDDAVPRRLCIPGHAACAEPRQKTGPDHPRAARERGAPGLERGQAFRSGEAAMQ